MTKRDCLWCAKRCFLWMSLPEQSKSDARYWETRMYEHLFAWAGWKDYQ
jgi:hypothetical protein